MTPSFVGTSTSSYRSISNCRPCLALLDQCPCISNRRFAAMGRQYPTALTLSSTFPALSLMRSQGR